jgi:hypothetical protein
MSPNWTRRQVLRRGGTAAAGVISVNSEGPYFAVTAHDAGGRQLGRSATVKRTTA